MEIIWKGEGYLPKINNSVKGVEQKLGGLDIRIYL